MPTKGFSLILRLLVGTSLQSLFFHRPFMRDLKFSNSNLGDFAFEKVPTFMHQINAYEICFYFFVRYDKSLSTLTRYEAKKFTVSYRGTYDLLSFSLFKNV